MIYEKNVPQIERLIRIAIGLVLVVAVALVPSLFGEYATTALVVAAVSDFFLAMTGFVGWCPACAVMGRKLKANQPKHE
jgi:VIT1/CCC1 family predicted Fe2+/Mn2+ transporter